MKLIYSLLLCVLFSTQGNSQERFLTKNGSITFFSSTVIEDIKADNNQVLSIIDTGKGKMAIAILMKSFMFKKALMQEHFNESYVESDKFPKATFKGNILNFSEVTSETKKIEVEGEMTIHGITKKMTIEAAITKTEEQILLKGKFFLKISDFNIEVPRVVAKNISKKIEVTFELDHKPYKK